MYAMNRMTYDYRLQFTKRDKMRYIGHLDLLKYFQRAIKRANVPIAFSMGFNPHQLVSFTMPLPLGMSGLAEYVDIRLESEMPCDDLKTRLNAQMSDGMEITAVRRLREDEDTGAALVAAADYTAVLDICDPDFADKLASLKAVPVWEIEKLGKKKKLKTVDIRPLIYALDCETAENTVIHARLATGSNSNLKPELMLRYIYEKLGLDFDYIRIKIARTEMYRRDESGNFTGLME